MTQPGKRETPQSIRDIESIRTVLDDIEKFKAFKRVFPLFRPFLRWGGADVAKLEELLGSMEEIGYKMYEMTQVLDRFNEFFSDRGWISYETMNFEVTTSALSKAEAGDWDAAEAELVEHFSEEEVRRGLGKMNAVQAFRPRLPLAWKAMEDYAANRFHACVPVVLALLDGMVNEIHQKIHGTRRGISAEGVDLHAWDSIAAHTTGLNRLVKIFQTGRRKTSSEAITLPYRNGIMHGIDLGYDNKIVAAKCWAALFATREWAIKAETGQHEAPPPKPAPTLEDSWNQLVENTRRYREIQEANKRLEDWTRRRVQVGVDIPRNGELESYEFGTAERKLVEYLTYWSNQNYGYMARCIANFAGLAMTKAAAEVRKEFGGRQLFYFELVELYEETYAITVITVRLKFKWNDVEFDVQHPFRMVLEGEDGRLVLPGVGPSEWKVINWTFPDVAVALSLAK